MRGLGPTMTARDQSIGISIGMLDKLISTTLGVKSGAPSTAGPGADAPPSHAAGGIRTDLPSRSE
jgi:hypothetical protein